MNWIKRNLIFVVGSAVALILMGLAGWFLYSKYNLNAQVLADLNADTEKLKTLNSQNPHPGNKDVNNIKLAQEQRAQLRDFISKCAANFKPIEHIPEGTNVTDRDFSSSLSRTIAQLQTDATNASVVLLPNYNFSFEAQKSLVMFAPGSPDKLAVQLGEVKAIAQILFDAKINGLNNIRRERVSPDDARGPLADYLNEKTVTNDLAVVTPYEVTFRCFSSELATVLSGFGSSPHWFIVKTINVEPAPAEAQAESTIAYAGPGPANPYAGAIQAPQRQEAPNAEATFRARYGLGGGGGGGGGRYGGGGQTLGGIQYRPLGSGTPTYAPQPVYAPAPGMAVATSKGGLPTVLDEKLLKITINLVLVKLLPQK